MVTCAIRYVVWKLVFPVWKLHFDIMNSHMFIFPLYLAPLETFICGFDVLYYTQGVLAYLQKYLSYMHLNELFSRNSPKYIAICKDGSNYSYRDSWIERIIIYSLLFMWCILWYKHDLKFVSDETCVYITTVFLLVAVEDDNCMWCF
jgi:hypothetical protein